MVEHCEEDIGRWESDGGAIPSDGQRTGTAQQLSVQRPTPDFNLVSRWIGRVGLSVIALVLSCTILSAQQRAVWGVVTDSQGRPIKGAAVKLTNTITLGIRSYITQESGEYRFRGLHPDIDYRLRARFHERTSKTQTITRFNERKTTRIDLRIDGATAKPAK
jgi:hypothetical protein